MIPLPTKANLAFDLGLLRYSTTKRRGSRTEPLFTPKNIPIFLAAIAFLSSTVTFTPGTPLNSFLNRSANVSGYSSSDGVSCSSRTSVIAAATVRASLAAGSSFLATVMANLGLSGRFVFLEYGTASANSAAHTIRWTSCSARCAPQALTKLSASIAHVLVCLSR